MGRGGADYSSLEGDTMYKTAKWTTFVISFLTALAGAALIGIGVYGLTNPLGSAMVPMTLPIVAIATGCVVILLSLVGCVGTLLEYRTVLWVYFGLLTTLVILQLVVGVMALNNRGDTINDLMNKRWDYLYEHKPRHIRYIQDQYECCGLEKVDDRAWPKHGTYTCSTHPSYGYDQPCKNPVKAEWDERQKVFGIGVLTLAGLQLLGLIPTYYLASRIPSDEERERSLLDEHRRLLAGHANPLAPSYGTTPGWEAARAGGSLSHTVGGPAGSYPYPGSRPGSRAA